MNIRWPERLPALLAALATLPALAGSAGQPLPDANETQSPATWLLERNTDGPLERTAPNPHDYGRPWIRVDVKSQLLTYFDAWGVPVKRYAVSTAKNGLGELKNSYQTPRGWHRVCERIGDGVAPDTIIFRREVTPWKYTRELHEQYPNKDWILTRILWLCGMEPGKNQGGEVDSYERAIYIHGAGEHVAYGTPTSLGCVRMKSEDVIDLFNRTPNGTDVVIEENR